MILRKHSNLELHRTTLSVRQIKKIHRATAELKASGIERQALKIGDRAPSFALVQSGSRAGGLERSLREGHWWSAFSGDTGDLIATWSWRLYTESILKSEYSVFTLPDYLRDLYKSFGNALDRFHDEAEYRLPIPARYVVDKQGIIRAAHVNLDYTIRPESSNTLRQLRMLTG